MRGKIKRKIQQNWLTQITSHSDTTWSGLKDDKPWSHLEDPTSYHLWHVFYLGGGDGGCCASFLVPGYAMNENEARWMMFIVEYVSILWVARIICFLLLEDSHADGSSFCKSSQTRDFPFLYNDFPAGLLLFKEWNRACYFNDWPHMHNSFSVD